MRKRGQTWRRLVPRFGPFLDFLTSDNVGIGWRVGAGTDCPSLRDTQSIATFTIVFFEPLKSDKVLIKAKKQWSETSGELQSIPMHRRVLGIDQLAFHQQCYLLIYLFIYFYSGTARIKSSSSQKGEGKVVTSVDFNFRCNNDINTTTVFFSPAEGQNICGRKPQKTQHTRVVLTDELMTASWQLVWDTYQKTRTGLFIYYFAGGSSDNVCYQQTKCSWLLIF